MIRSPWTPTDLVLPSILVVKAVALKKNRLLVPKHTAPRRARRSTPLELLQQRHSLRKRCLRPDPVHALRDDAKATFWAIAAAFCEVPRNAPVMYLDRRAGKEQVTILQIQGEESPPRPRARGRRLGIVRLRDPVLQPGIEEQNVTVTPIASHILMICCPCSLSSGVPGACYRGDGVRHRAPSRAACESI